MRLMNRQEYLDNLINVMETPNIKIITDVRRSEKSKLLECSNYLGFEAIKMIQVVSNVIKLRNRRKHQG